MPAYIGSQATDYGPETAVDMGRLTQILEVVARANDRVRTGAEELDRIGNRLFGAAPSQLNKAVNPPQPSAIIARLDEAGAALMDGIGKLEEQIGRFQSL